QRVGPVVISKRDRMSHRMIANPMARVVRSLRLTIGRRLPQLFADNEEAGFDLVPLKSSQDESSGLLVGSIVESQCDAGHSLPPGRRGCAAVSAFPNKCLASRQFRWAIFI